MDVTLNGVRFFNVKNVTIHVDKDVDVEIRPDKFTNGLNLRKDQFGEGETAVVITPRVSNEIVIR